MTSDENDTLTSNDARLIDDGVEERNRHDSQSATNERATKIKANTERPAYISFFDPIVEHYTRAPNAEEW